jgi:hypothetical protein
MIRFARMSNWCTLAKRCLESDRLAAIPLLLAVILLVSVVGRGEPSPAPGGDSAVAHAEKLIGSDDSPQSGPDPQGTTSQNNGSIAQAGTALIPAPGTDASRYVPGSTVRSYNPFDTFHLGKILIRPSATIGYTYESNLLADPSASYADHSLGLEPAIEAFIPVGANGIRMDYSMQWRDYRHYDLQHAVDHTFNADSQFDFSPILNLALRDHFAMNSLDSREYVPGREVLFSDAGFRRNEVEGQLNWTPSDTDMVALRAGYNRVTFDQSANPDELPFYDYSECRYSAIYKRSVSQLTSLFFDGSYRNVPTGDPRAIANSNGYEAVAGVESVITPLLSGQFSIGVRGDRYPGAGIENSRTLVYRGSILKEITDTNRITFSMSHGTGMSYFQRNAYFVTQGYGITYSHEIGRSLYLSFSPGYLRNSYPLPVETGPGIPNNAVGEHRVDGLVEISFDTRYAFTDWIAVEVWFDYLRRRSTLQDYSFTDYRFGANLVLGSRSTAVGRSPY